jgi:hypothetical protein
MTTPAARLSEIRASSCYPAFRMFIQISSVLGYLACAVFAFASFAGESPGAILLVVPLAILCALLVRVVKEMSLMLADIADTTISGYARNISPLASLQSIEVKGGTPMAAKQVEPAPSDSEQMAKHGIRFDGEKYCFREYRYDRLSDAISYAELQAKRS